MTNAARGPAALRERPPGPGAGLAPGGVHAPPDRNPYSVREAAALLGVSPDAIEAHYAQLGGRRVGRRILIPRWAVDGMVRDPRDADRGGDADGTPTLERVLALLPRLAPEERLRVAQAALAGPSA